MLTALHIQNYRLVHNLHLELHLGLNILTGETGAGKSILVDAVDLALGARIDAEIVRPGCKQCHISLCFDLTKIPKAQAWLQDQGFEDEASCIIKRSISEDGRSKTTVNGHPCPQNLVRHLSALVLNIHGQHEHQILLKREHQQRLLDNYADNHALLEQISQQYKEWNGLEKERLALLTMHQDREQQLDFLRFQLQELETLQLSAGEWETLGQAHKALHQNHDLLNHVNQTIFYLSENHSGSIAEQLKKALLEIKAIKRPDSPLQSAQELIDSALIHIEEAHHQLFNFQKKLDVNPQRLQSIEERLSALHTLSRKHRCNPSELFEIQITLQKRLSDLENIDQHFLEIEQAKAHIENAYHTLALTLTQRRKKAALNLASLITHKMQNLGMKEAQFKVELEPTADAISKEGSESIHFLVCSNPGQAFQPLQKVASGGELSRLSLALQVIGHEKNNIPTLIFDEVDSGIGGTTAEIVGQLLKELGQSTQVICITHLPQVAAQGHHHFKVEKTVQDSHTISTITLLDHKKRVAELARMLSGTKVTPQILAHAEEMLI
jgi:DNA repair protein RecN (Recombination protein N)